MQSISFTSHTSSSSHRRGQRTLGIEHLEARQLMAYNVLNYAPVPLGPSQTPAAEVRSLAYVTPAAAPASLAAAAAKSTVTKVDLDVTLQEDYVVPVQAKDLNLRHFYGGEKIVIPTVVKNYGPDTAKGSVTVSVYLSTTQTIGSTAIKLGEKNVNVSLTDNSTHWVEVNATVPSTLKAGANYWIIAKLTTPIKQSTINDVRGSDRQFEFLGTPSNKAAFEAQYFNFVRSALNRELVIRSSPNDFHQINDPKVFIGTFEGDSLKPYMNAKNMPTIGVGINLDALSASMTSKVASTVRAYYLSHYGKVISPFNDEGVITMLKDQAKKGNAPAAIDAQDNGYLFNALYDERTQSAINVLGKTTWSRLNPPAKIAVMDMVFDFGTIYADVVQALQALDYVRAGFELVDIESIALSSRTLAEYQNLVYAQTSALGKIVKI